MKSVSILFIVLLIIGCTNKQYQPTAHADSNVEASRINPKIIQAVIQVESSGNPNAINRKSGAIGLMQILPSTGRSIGYSKEQLKNPKTNVEAGTKYLNKLMNEYCSNNIHCALRSYFCGPGNRNKKACYKYADKVLGKVSNPINSKKKYKNKRTNKKPNETIEFKPWTGYKFD